MGIYRPDIYGDTLQWYSAYTNEGNGQTISVVDTPVHLERSTGYVEEQNKNMGVGTNQEITLSTMSTTTSIISFIISSTSSIGFQPHIYFNLQLAPIFSKPNFSKSLSASNFEVIESNIGLLSDTCLTLSNN